MDEVRDSQLLEIGSLDHLREMFGNVDRLRWLAVLSVQPRTSEDLQQIFSVSQAQVSKQLKVLRVGGWILTTRSSVQHAHQTHQTRTPLRFDPFAVFAGNLLKQAFEDTFWPDVLVKPPLTSIGTDQTEKDHGSDVGQGLTGLGPGEILWLICDKFALRVLTLLALLPMTLGEITLTIGPSVFVELRIVSDRLESLGLVRSVDKDQPPNDRTFSLTSRADSLIWGLQEFLKSSLEDRLWEGDLEAFKKTCYKAIVISDGEPRNFPKVAYERVCKILSRPKA